MMKAISDTMNWRFWLKKWHIKVLQSF